MNVCFQPPKYKENIATCNFISSKKRNLDDITKNIYKENVQLTDAFKLHNKEMEQLKKLNGKLLNENATLKGSTNGNDALVKEKVEDSAQKAKKIKEVRIPNPL